MFYRSLLSAALLLGAVSLAPAVDMYTGMGTAPGIPFLANAPTFGENVVDIGDDNSTGAIDITSVFPSGINIFGRTFTSMYVNNNGNVTFDQALGTFAAANNIITSAAHPIFAVFLADVDTRGVLPNLPTPGGTSTGTNRVFWDLDPARRAITITWDDVGYFPSQSDLLNAFQMRITRLGNNSFTIEYRYESINWVRGSASGGNLPVAGWSGGDGVNFALTEGSGTTETLNWDTDAGIATTIIRFENGRVVNHAPVAIPVVVRVRGDTLRDFTLRVTDPDRDALYYALWDNGATPALPEHGGLSHIGTPRPDGYAAITGYPGYTPNPNPDLNLNDATYWVTSPTFRYTPTAAYRGNDTVYYWVRDRAPRTDSTNRTAAHATGINATKPSARAPPNCCLAATVYAT